ncbi:MAG: Gfo/Idh/MocA family oxidoreductase [Planctomycetes bacterium]|nr:Gfo/Idh/MocA family oxidoreductase [Planctomycetota bacterium]
MPLRDRRHFLATTLAGGAALLFLPRGLRGAARGRPGALATIQVAQIGCGRMGREDMKGVLASPLARVVAVCDVDAKRLAAGKALAEEHYQKRGESDVQVAAVADVRELLARADIDALVVSTPDHSHAWIAVAAALAGKHLYVQKPLTYDVGEALALRRAVQAKGVVLQVGSQQRSSAPWPAFRIAAAAVRAGRIGRVQEVRIGLGTDTPSGKKPAPSAPPPHLDYDRWLGPAPEADYMEGRVHPQESLSGRPGWITTESYGLGMITNWGAHHLDIAQWALRMELSGPRTVEARADFMQDDQWTVHRGYHVEIGYAGGTGGGAASGASGAGGGGAASGGSAASGGDAASGGPRVVLDDRFEVGLEFVGEEGTLFCTRGSGQVTASDPNAAGSKAALRASDAKLLLPLPESAETLLPSSDHYANWLEAIRDRKAPVAPVDQAARSLTVCYLSWLAMRLGRKLEWDPTTERFVGDDEANGRLARPRRKSEFDVDALLKTAGI